MYWYFCLLALFSTDGNSRADFLPLLQLNWKTETNAISQCGRLKFLAIAHGAASCSHSRNCHMFLIYRCYCAYKYHFSVCILNASRKKIRTNQTKPKIQMIFCLFWDRITVCICVFDFVFFCTSLFAIPFIIHIFVHTSCANLNYGTVHSSSWNWFVQHLMLTAYCSACKQTLIAHTHSTSKYINIYIIYASRAYIRNEKKHISQHELCLCVQNTTNQIPFISPSLDERAHRVREKYASIYFGCHLDHSLVVVICFSLLLLSLIVAAAVSAACAKWLWI